MYEAMRAWKKRAAAYGGDQIGLTGMGTTMQKLFRQYIFILLNNYHKITFHCANSINL